MALSALGRKHLLSHGSQRKLARKHGFEESRLSAVVNWVENDPLPKTEVGWNSWRQMQTAVAEALGMDVAEAFSAQERGQVEQALSA